MPSFGLLNIDKPRWTTSRRVVDRVQRLVRPAKAGHAGTLDPLATGVLVVCVGPATRLIPYVQQMSKHYTATFLLGQKSPSDDIETDVEVIQNAPQPVEADIRAAAGLLVGKVQQRPPAFSAVKLHGRRAYTLARRGESVQISARTVTIHNITVIGYEYPQLDLTIHCGSGTYVRSLGRDLAEALGTTAVMSALTRTAVGPFHQTGACSLEELTADTLADALQPAERAVGDLPVVQLTDDEFERIGRGLAISKQITGHADAVEFAAMNRSGDLVSILTRHGPDQLRPLKNLQLGS